MPTSSSLDLKLVSCKEKLINLTRQNNLLFYKKRKTSSLVVKPENMQSFYDALLDEKNFVSGKSQKKRMRNIMSQRKGCAVLMIPGDL